MINWIIYGIIAIVLIIIVAIYNRLVSLRNQVKNSWAQIDVQLKRRNDLIPNLINTVKGYMKHEKSVLEEVTKARTAIMNSSTVEDSAKASNQLSGTLKSLFAVSENYPDLKANTTFLQLQEEITSTENKIAYARQHYNDIVMFFNNQVETFPSNIFAKLFGFDIKSSFEATDSEKKNIEVGFN